MEALLAFANDIVFFYRASLKSFHALNTILEEFSDFFGFEINISKIFATFSTQMHDKMKHAFILGFQVQTLPIMYLGVALTGKFILHRECDYLIVDLQGIHTCWSHCSLVYPTWGGCNSYNGTSMGSSAA